MFGMRLLTVVAAIGTMNAQSLEEGESVICRGKESNLYGPVYRYVEGKLRQYPSIEVALS